MHEQHVVYRVEENTRWNLHPGRLTAISRVAVARRGVRPSPGQRFHSGRGEFPKGRHPQIMMQARTLSAALRNSNRVAADQNQHSGNADSAMRQ